MHKIPPLHLRPSEPIASESVSISHDFTAYQFLEILTCLDCEILFLKIWSDRPFESELEYCKSVKRIRELANEAISVFGIQPSHNKVQCEE